jgi:2'-5' RNA ligase
MNSKLTDLAEWGSFALVTYIPEPLGLFLHGLREQLPGDDNPQAHITVLPPRPLQVAVEQVAHEAQSVLRRFQPFAVELSDVKAFPDTNILYLDIVGGNEHLHELHARLNSGKLAHVENFAFLPHLTISGSVPKKQLAKVLNEAKKAWTKHVGDRTFQVSEVVALWQRAGGSPDDWNRVWSQKLGKAGNSARAGH